MLTGPTPPTITGNQLLHEMTVRGFTVRGLAGALEVSPSTVIKWRQTGDAALKPLVAAALALVFAWDATAAIERVLPRFDVLRNG